MSQIVTEALRGRCGGVSGRRILEAGCGTGRVSLELARAVESELPHDIRAASQALFVEPIEVNRALLRSLLVASRLEQPRET